MQMEQGSNKLRFTYDALGASGVIFNGTNYYYEKNAQGDILGIVDTNRNFVVNYNYDAWGTLLSTTGSMANTLGELNPLRYRGYVYDTETNFYYLQSRYYNPELGRFLNADKYFDTLQGLNSTNMFMYCGNSPINAVDYSGEIAFWDILDLHFAAESWTKFVTNPSWGGFFTAVLDTVGALPIIPSASYITRGADAVETAASSANKIVKTTSPPSQALPIPNSKDTSVVTDNLMTSPYSNLVDPPSVGPGKKFTQAQKEKIIQQNMINNGGVVRSDLSGEILTQPLKSMKGVIPSPMEWQIDHILPISAGGTNSYSNAQVLSRQENRAKWDK